MGTAPPDPKSIYRTAAARPSDTPVLEPRIRAALLVRHISLALALTASAALLVDYRNAGDPAFCGVASGCFAVRVSAYSSVFGIPLPNLALPAFALLFAGALLARTFEQQRLVAAAAGLGGLLGVALILIQKLVIGTFCPWCIVVDASAIVCAAASIAIALWIGKSAERASAAAVGSSGAIAWGAAGALAIGLPFLWAQFPAVVPPPPEIAVEQQPDKVTIVSFTDFECPFCRKLHPTLDQLREQYKDRLRFVRKMKPLSGHAGALPAAKAWICAPEAQRDAVAAALYAAEPDELSSAKKLLTLADRFDLGGRAAFAACMQAKSTEEEIERDSNLFAKVGGRGLPLTWVGGRVIMGLNPDKLTQAVEAQIAGRPSLPVSAMFALLGAAIVAASLVSLRARAR